MRLVVADCEAVYKGRLHATLPMARRLLIIKSDGTLIIHADIGSKALNWMPAPCNIEVDDSGWTVTNAKGTESLHIRIEQIVSDVSVELGTEPGLTKSGSELELQALLADDVTVIEPGLELIRREYPTDLGPVDLLCVDPAGQTVAVEVKRVGEIDGVEQLTRYLERLNRDTTLGEVRGIFCAGSIKPQAQVLANARGISCAVVDFDVLAGRKAAELRLF